MICIENSFGTIEISHEYFAKLIGYEASQCFGVSGMVATTASQGIRSFLFRKDAHDKGVKVRSSGKRLIIDLHIAISYGVNISAIVKSIVHKVKYTVEDITNLTVERVNVHVDTMKISGSGSRKGSVMF